MNVRKVFLVVLMVLAVAGVVSAQQQTGKDGVTLGVRLGRDTGTCFVVLENKNPCDVSVTYSFKANDQPIQGQAVIKANGGKAYYNGPGLKNKKGLYLKGKDGIGIFSTTRVSITDLTIIKVDEY